MRARVSLGERGTRSAGAVGAPADDDPALEGVISGLRMTETVVRALPEDEGVNPAARGCDRELVKQGGQWVVQKLG